MNIDLPNQKERMTAHAAPQTERNTIVSENGITAALASKMPSAADRTFEPGDEVLVFREKVKVWEGPQTVTLVDDKIMTLQDFDSDRVTRFNKQQIKPYFHDSSGTDIENDPT
jgi:hypothetical protein